MERKNFSKFDVILKINLIYNQVIQHFKENLFISQTISLWSLSMKYFSIVLFLALGHVAQAKLVSLEFRRSGGGAKTAQVLPLDGKIWIQYTACGFRPHAKSVYPETRVEVTDAALVQDLNEIFKKHILDIQTQHDYSEEYGGATGTWSGLTVNSSYTANDKKVYYLSEQFSSVKVLNAQGKDIWAPLSNLIDVSSDKVCAAIGAKPELKVLGMNNLEILNSDQKSVFASVDAPQPRYRSYRVGNRAFVSLSLSKYSNLNGASFDIPSDVNCQIDHSKLTFSNEVGVGTLFAASTSTAVAVSLTTSGNQKIVMSLDEENQKKWETLKSFPQLDSVFNLILPCLP